MVVHRASSTAHRDTPTGLTVWSLSKNDARRSAGARPETWRAGRSEPARPTVRRVRGVGRGSHARLAHNHGARLSVPRPQASAPEKLRTTPPAQRPRDTLTALARNRDHATVFGGFLSGAGCSVGPYARNQDARVRRISQKPSAREQLRMGLCRAAAWIRDDVRAQPPPGVYPRPRSSLSPVLASAPTVSCGAGRRFRAPWFGTRKRIPVYSMTCWADQRDRSIRSEKT